MTLVKHKHQRIAILIDVQNMYHSAKAIYKKRVNFKEILKTAVAGRQLIRAIGYVIRTESGEEKSFFDALSNIGIELKIKDLQIFSSGTKKADWDVGLTMDAVRFADSAIDALIIVTGDGDFVPLVEYLKGKGKQVEVIGFGKSTSSKLRETVDDFTDLCENPKKFLI